MWGLKPPTLSLKSPCESTFFPDSFQIFFFRLLYWWHFLLVKIFPRKKDTFQKPQRNGTQSTTGTSNLSGRRSSSQAPPIWNQGNPRGAGWNQGVFFGMVRSDVVVVVVVDVVFWWKIREESLVYNLGKLRFGSFFFGGKPDVFLIWPKVKGLLCFFREAPIKSWDATPPPKKNKMSESWKSSANFG